MFILFIVFYIIPMLFVLLFGLLADAQEATLKVAIPVAVIPVVNVLASIGCISITIRTTIDWLSR